MNETIEQMIHVKDLIAQHKFELKRLEQREELLSIKLVGVLKEKGINEMILPNCKFGTKLVSRTAFSQKLFSQENPDLYNQYRITTETERFEFKIGNFRK